MVIFNTKCIATCVNNAGQHTLKDNSTFEEKITVNKKNNIEHTIAKQVI